jgi:hypothetical protein
MLEFVMLVYGNMGIETVPGFHSIEACQNAADGINVILEKLTAICIEVK